MGVRGAPTSRRTFLSAALASLAAGRTAAGQGVAGQTAAGTSNVPRTASRPNLILIVAGQWRAQAVPWSGDPNFQTPEIGAPNLTKFGRESLTFSRAYSCYPSPGPARSAILSGRFPHAPAGPQLGTLLGLAGYRASQFTSLQVDDLISFVHARGPFFAHWQMEEPAGFTLRLDPAALQLRPNVPAPLEVRARERLAEFYGRVPAWDQQIGILLAALDRPELEDTIVVFTSGCGEQMGSQGMIVGDSAFEESVRIPLAIRYPRRWPKGSGSDLLVSQSDLLPTLLGLCGFVTPPGAQGANLAPLITEGQGDRPDRHATPRAGHLLQLLRVAQRAAPLLVPCCRKRARWRHEHRREHERP